MHYDTPSFGFKRLAFRGLWFSQCFYDDVHLNRSVALGIGKHASGGKLFQESGLEGYPAVELADGCLGRDAGTV